MTIDDGIKREAREAQTSASLWRKRGPELVAQIDSYIEKASLRGQHGIDEPSDINPNGDSIIWLKETDRPIHKFLMDHYRREGFTVEEYTPVALKITW